MKEIKSPPPHRLLPMRHHTIKEGRRWESVKGALDSVKTHNYCHRVRICFEISYNLIESFIFHWKSEHFQHLSPKTCYKLDTFVAVKWCIISFSFIFHFSSIQDFLQHCDVAKSSGSLPAGLYPLWLKCVPSQARQSPGRSST